MFDTIGSFMLPVAFLAVFYLLVIRPQKKKEKEISAMRSQLAVGDNVVTIGGLIGKIVKIKDDEVTIEVGSDKNKIVLKKWAIGTTDKKNSSEVAESSAKSE